MVEFKESLQYHNFFQKIYGNGSKDDLCYGMGLKVPRVPFLFQTIPEKRAFEFLEMFDICDGSIVTDARRRQAMKDLIYDYSNDWMRHLAGGQVECKLDGARFTSKAAFYLHLRGAHPDRFEDLERLLRSLTEDMEQDHLGNFFTKLFYSDAIYPVLPSAGQLSPLDCEFPSVVAPDLSKGMSKAEKKKKKRKKKKAAQRQRQRGGSVGGPPPVMPGEGVPSRRAHALDIVPQKELLSMERRVFGEMFEREGLSFDSDSEMLPPLVTIPQEALASVEDEETRRKREAAIIAEAQNVKQAMQHAVKAKAKDATPASPAEKEAALPPPSVSASSSGKSPRVPAVAAATAPASAAELVKPQPAVPLVSPRASARAQAKEKEKEKEREREREKEREREREREEANAKREKEEKAQQQRAAEKAKATAAAAAKQRQQQQAQQKKLSEAENEERQRKEQQAQVLRKIQKQLEEEITQGIVEEVVLDLCQKLVARTVQGERKVMEQQKMQEEAKVKQQEDLARSLERGRKKQERKARQEGRKQETEGWSNGLLDEVVARECRELVREVMFELAQEKRDINVWQIRASMQPPAATPSPPTKSFLEPAVYAQPPPQRAVSAAEKAERMAQQRAVWSNPSATRAIVAGPKVMPPLSEPVPILHPSAFPALSDTMSISPRSSGHHRRRAQPSLDMAGGSSFDETQHTPHTTYGLGEEAYYGAYGEATWQQQQQQDDELTDGDAFGAEQTSGLGSFRSPSVGSESFDDDEDELEMPSTQDVAEALEFGEHEGEEEPTEEMDSMPMPSGEYEEYGFTERYYPPYASNMGSESVFSNPFSFFGFTSASADAFSEPEASLPASFAFDTPPVYTTAPQQPDMLPAQQQSTPASTSSSAYGRGQRSDSLPPQAGAIPSSPDSSGPTGWPLRSVPEDWGMDPARSVACYNVPPEFAKKGEIANFFKLAKCTIAVDPSFNHLIQFLRGPDNGCCFVQFETKADVKKALARNGANLGNNEITVSLPFGLQTSESGQRFAFNPQSRNIARDAPPTAILFGKEAIGLRIGQGIGGLNPVAPEFRPRRSGSFSNRGPPGMDEAGVGGPPGSSSSSFFGSDPTGGYGGATGEDGGRTATPPPGLGGIAMLNAEQDSVVTPSERTKAYGALGTVGSPVPASSFLSTMHPYPAVMPSLSPGWSFGAEGGEAGYSAFHFPPAFGGHSYFGGEQQMHGGLPNGGGVMGGPPVVDVTSLEGVDLLHAQTAAYMGVDPYAHLPPPHLQHLQPRPQYPHYNPPQ